MKLQTLSSLVTKSLLIIGLSSVLTSCQFMQKVESKAKKIVLYEKAALNLSKENRELKAEVSSLKFKIAELEEKNSYLQLKIDGPNGGSGRGPASVNARNVVLEVEQDLVRDSVFNWDPAQLLSVAEVELKKNNFEKSAQFYRTLVKKYPTAKSVNDQVLLQAAIAAYETGKYYSWTHEYIDNILTSYPTSAFFRAAKLYKGLAYLKENNKEEFFKIVEEFRLKYRNTPEWKIVSAHYEEFLKRYK